MWGEPDLAGTAVDLGNDAEFQMIKRMFSELTCSYSYEVVEISLNCIVQFITLSRTTMYTVP